MKTVPLFHCTQPCSNCPYRTDAPLQLWHKTEFKKLLAKEHDYLGTIYHCHKNNGSACVGWMMKQAESNFPSIHLRIDFQRHNIPKIYFDRLNSPAPLYDNVTQMIKANYPELLKALPTATMKLQTIVSKFKKGILKKQNPTGKCFVVCASMEGFLQIAGYRVKLIEGEVWQGKKLWMHYWLEYNNVIIDPTASQFKTPTGEEMPEIYIGIKPDWYNIVKK